MAKSTHTTVNDPIVEELRRLYPLETVARGLEYQAQGMAQIVSVTREPPRMWAMVRNPRGSRYRCELRWLPQDDAYFLASACTCSWGQSCKHVVAALLQGRAQIPVDLGACRSAHSGSAPLQPDAAAPPRPALPPPALEPWLQRLRASIEPKPDTYPESVPERLLYQLFPESYSGGATRLRVLPSIARPKKSGGFSSPRAFGGALQSPARFLLPVDAELIRELRSRQPPHDSGLWLSDEWGPPLLRRMLATGRCYLGSALDRALREGPSRSAAFVWDSDEQARQQLTLRLAQGEVLSTLTPTWYLDAASGELGAVDSGVPAELASELLRAPRLDPAQVHGLAEALAAALGPHAAAVPPPQQLSFRDLDDVTPVPCLRLMRDELLAPYEPDDDDSMEADCARLSFDYAGLRVPWGERKPVLHVRDGATLLRMRRDPAAEQRAGRLLMGLGLQPQLSADGDSTLFTSVVQSLWLALLERHVPELRRQGWRVDIDPDFGIRLVEPDGEWHAELAEQGQQWLDLSLDVLVEGQRVALLPLLVQLLRRSASGSMRSLPADQAVYVRLDEQRYLKLDVARLKPILSTLLELYDPRPLQDNGRLRLPRMAATWLDALQHEMPLRLRGAESLRQLADELRAGPGVQALPPPAGLKAQLRPYQQQGFEWLQFLRRHALGGVLADDMGLGKTVQTLAHLLAEKEGGRMDRPSLVVAPTSLMFNWRREAQVFAPDLRVLTLHGKARGEDFERVARHDLVLTTYSLVLRDFDALSRQPWHLLVLDEAQAVKNPKAKGAQLVRRLDARHRLCLTGTPMENHLGELWALVDFLMPGFLGEESAFKRRFRTPIERHADAQVRTQLARRVRPFLLRRTKSEVAAELPPRTDIVRSVALEGAQRDLYETVRLAVHEKVRAEIERRGLAQSQILILDALLKLRQICCDPRLLKMDAARSVKTSAKMELLMTLLPEMLEEGRRVLLFSQFTSMLALIEPELQRRGIRYAKLTGESRDREAIVGEFQSGAVPLFLVSLKAGGVGLNLTAADTVIHYDPWWNPAVEQQATDRAHRIGQDKPVFVYRLLTEGTVEEKIALLQERKRGLASALLDQGAGALGVEPEEIAELFAPLA